MFECFCGKLYEMNKKDIKKWIPPVLLDYVRKTRDEYTVKRLFSADDICFHKTQKNNYTENNCFIVGAGSSVKNQDLSTLTDQITITVSNVFVHPEIETICPTYHVLPNVFLTHAHIYGKENYVLWLKEMDTRLPESTIMVLHVLDKDIISENGIFLKRKVFWYGTCFWDEEPLSKINPVSIPAIWSVSEVALSVAIYFGFSEINLLGFDHDWFNGLMVYFYGNNEHKVGIDEKKVTFSDSEFQMRRHAYIFKKYKALLALHGNIFNCNANENTYVDVFPKRNFEETINFYKVKRRS